MFIPAIFFSCERDDVRKQNAIYNEWQWKATEMLDGQVYQTSQDIDTTYYYNFREDGILQIKDINKIVKTEIKFQIHEGESSRGTMVYRYVGSNAELHFMYSIDNGELRLTNVEGIIVWVAVFEIVN